jgi:hypothetical protein
MITAKHYLQVTKDDFERSAKSGAMVVQNQVQQAAAPFRTDTQGRSEAESFGEVTLARAGSCEAVRSEPIPPRGLEQSAETTEKQGVGAQSGTDSGTPLDKLAALAASLSPADRARLAELLLPQTDGPRTASASDHAADAS